MPPGKADESRVRFREADASLAYNEGDLVEYKSASSGQWISAKVLKVKGHHLYDLDCKPDVPAERMRPLVEKESIYSTGEKVEYFSVSQGKWIPAKVLQVKGSGRLELDCKSDVSDEYVRKKRAPGSFEAGARVEYYSTSQGNWIAAKIVAVKPDGKFDLDCKADAALENIRPPALPPGSRQVSEEQFEPDEQVEYFGAKLQRWIPAKVLRRNDDGTFDLDCKPQVPRERLRKAGRSETRSAASSRTGSPLSTVQCPLYKEGDKVEYFSSSQSRWIPARVLGTTAEGNFNLDCKADVAANKIRLPAKREAQYQVDDAVEYFGASRGQWIPTKVSKVNEDGTYDLACKPRVLAENIRLPDKSEARPPGTQKGPVYNIGDQVEYFGASQNRWISAKVLSMTPAGNYNLDVKQDVPVDRLRSGLARAPDRPAPGDPGSPSYARANASTMPPGSTLSSVSALMEPQQLLRSIRRPGLAGGYKLEVCPEAASALESMGQRGVVAIALCGTCQSGKTYLANHLLDRPQQGLPVLQVGGSLWSTTRTEGVWLWAGGADKDERSPVILLLDCEGFGGSGASVSDNSCHGASRDMQLLALCWLLSSAIVMNTTGTLDEATFDQLKSASHFSDIVEERGTEAYGKPALLWALRDFAELPHDGKGRTLSSDEYLEQCLHDSRELSKESARKACGVRHGLVKFFRHRSCDVIPSPQASRLESAGYDSLGKPFKDAVEKFRSKLFSAGLSRPKAVNGKTLGCVAFVALLKQLVASVNDGRILSLHAAWESVQHTSCGSLSDELRGEASSLFQSLAAGRPIEGGAKLPLSEEALFTVVRDRKRALKAQWEERAFGDESVRRTYWKELKTSLAREESMVKTQNARVADQQLMEGVKAWQEWLDKDEDTGTDEICNLLGVLMTRMPGASLSRASRIAIQAAARRMSATRSAVAHALERQTDLQRKAVAWGEKAAQQEGTARSELETQKAALDEAVERADKAEQECDELTQQVESQEAQLDAQRESLKEVMQSLEASRLREQELRAQQRVVGDSEASLRKELEQARADLAREDAERFAEERAAANASDASLAEQQRLKQLLEEVGQNIEDIKLELGKERETHGNEKLRVQQEHEQRVQDLRSKHEDERTLLRSKTDQISDEHSRMAEEMRQQLDNERHAHTRTKDDDKGRLLEHSRTAGVLEGKIIANTEENKGLRQRLQALEEKAHETELAIRQYMEEEKTLRGRIHQAQLEAAKVREETDRKVQDVTEEFAAQEKEIQEREEALEAGSDHINNLRSKFQFLSSQGSKEAFCSHPNRHGLAAGQPKCGCSLQ